VSIFFRFSTNFYGILKISHEERHDTSVRLPLYGGVSVEIKGREKSDFKGVRRTYHGTKGALYL